MCLLHSGSRVLDNCVEGCVIYLFYTATFDVSNSLYFDFKIYIYFVFRHLVINFVCFLVLFFYFTAS